MFRKLVAIFLTVSLCLTTVACGSNADNQAKQTRNTPPPSAQLTSGKYPVQQATYNDADGEYSLMLLNTPVGSPPVFRSTQLQMARLTDEEIKAGEKTFLQVDGSQAVMHLTEDFKIEYVHNVSETQTNPQTGETQTVVVRRESGFWAPFAGALAGQALGSLLFTPQYYVPPVYQSGGVLTGYGGYGNSYNRAVSSYQSRYNTPPAVEKNRKIFRATGNINRNSSTTTGFGSSSKKTTTFGSSSTSTKSTGSGFGSSKLRTNGSSNFKRTPTSFGSGRSTRSRSFGRRR